MLRKAMHSGKIQIGDIELECAVLDDEKRVFSGRAIAKALGSSRSGRYYRRKADDVDTRLPAYLSAKNLQGFISDDLREKLVNYVEYKVGSCIAHGVEVTVLPDICDVYLRAKDAGALLPAQEHIAAHAEIIIRAFAKIGVIAMVDEATGYQAVRDKEELSKLLSIYLSEERLKWAKRFPDIFYKEIYRLNKWSWPPRQVNKRPSIVGKYTNEIVYERLPEGVLEKLCELNPRDEVTKTRKYKHHQFLSENIGQPDLHNHLVQIVILMKVAEDWDHFMELVNKAFPKEAKIKADNIVLLSEN